MGKLLSWVAIAFAIYVAYKVMLALQRKSALRDAARAANAGSAGKAGSSGKSGASASPTSTPGGELVQLVSCAHCGLQLPRDEAVMREQEFYCGDAHARLGAPPRDVR